MSMECAFLSEAADHSQLFQLSVALDLAWTLGANGSETVLLRSRVPYRGTGRADLLPLWQHFNRLSP